MEVPWFLTVVVLVPPNGCPVQTCIWIIAIGRFSTYLKFWVDDWTKSRKMNRHLNKILNVFQNLNGFRSICNTTSNYSIGVEATEMHDCTLQWLYVISCLSKQNWLAVAYGELLQSVRSERSDRSESSYNLSYLKNTIYIRIVIFIIFSQLRRVKRHLK